MNKYPIIVFYSEEDECWVADIPDLHYCSAFGDTPEEALKEVQIALEGWLETAREEGIPIPEPNKSIQLIGFSNKPQQKAG